MCSIHHNFLSRLCGGELGGGVIAHAGAFLSRLCGGEPPAAGEMGHRGFLSRLCGGELGYRRAGCRADVSKPPMRR